MLGLKRFQQCEEHREPGRRFMLHGVPTRVFFHCGNVSAGTGWLSSKRQ
ncbi:putative thioredoxin protein [Caballeronia insecticola]|uniref:Putative thioredoxin protein n=1 Tax=Caballeronia insecticola TaxID=758793 RepID=R4WF33_9BURK|nr:putative thioredoxin protein [Caballeronia insecticola]